MEVSVIGGRFRVPGGLFGYLKVRVLSLGPAFSYV